MAESSKYPFSPMGRIYLLTADAIVPTAIQVKVYDELNAQAAGEYRIINSGLERVFLGWGSTAAEAEANSVAPAPSSKAILIMPGAVEVLRFPPESYFSGYSANPCNVYIQAGQGL